MSSKNVFKQFFKNKINKNKARREETGDETAVNHSPRLTMGSSTNVSGIWTAMDSEQGSIESDEGTAKNKGDKNHRNKDQADSGDLKKTVLAPSAMGTNLVHSPVHSQPTEYNALHMNIAYETVKESLRAVVRCSDVFPPLKFAGQAILEIVERYDAVKEIPKELGELNKKLRLLVEILEAGGCDINDDRLGGLARTFNEKARIIALKLDRSMASRIVRTTEDGAFIAREISSIMFAIEIAMMDVNLRTYKGISQLQETVSELKVLALLDKLKYVEGAGSNREDRQGCTKGTRIMLLADLLAWAIHPENKHIFWLNGMAGTGKTTVAETFCNLLFDQGVLSSSFFCSRKKLDRRNVRLIVPALAKGLARVYPEFQTELLEVLKDDLDFTGLGLEDQYMMLILQPAEKAFTSSSKMIVLVVDALDECEDTQAAEMFLKTVLLRKPVCGLRLLVTSRPEPKILKGFHSADHASLRLQDIETHLVQADIAVFLSNKLRDVEDLYTKYGSTWPPTEVQTIVAHAGTLFIYAATAVKYISDDYGDPVERLAKFASIRPPINAVEAIDEK
ncbi:hypothetical protein D9619_010629 [Psilocybe cf. subviscida]|uniref:NACHT domain-containing protein n=1 Tax=Psilocybe cf. subviscida TaxID=2480587 RepID=A0A8H5B8C6_9AGAR|nr:hypothetical protein D9619_010629 [Psilocybe cf. subviscida]